MCRWILAGGGVATLFSIVFPASAGPATAQPQHAPFPIWAVEPAWVDDQRPLSAAPATQPEQARPEPIPLPAAGIIGPAAITALLAAASLKKRRPRAKVMR